MLLDFDNCNSPYLVLGSPANFHNNSTWNNSTLIHSFSWILLLIHYLFRDFAMNSLSISRFHSKYTIHLANCPWIYFFRDFTLISLSHSRNHFVNICFFAKWPWIRYFERFHYKFPICFANCQWMHYLFRVSLWIHYLFREINMNSLSASRFYY